jgi:DnaK suppressor protein
MYTSTETRREPSIEDRKAALESKLEELSGSFQDRSGLTIENHPDLLDAIAMATDRDVLVQQMNINAHVLNEVRVALAAIESGDYGICEDCDDPIASRRLDAIPWARVCVKCQERRDRARATDEDENFSLAA